MFNLAQHPVVTMLPDYVSGVVDYQPSLNCLGLAVSVVRPRRIVELGVFRGDSLFFMAQAAGECSLTPEVFGVDWFQGDSAMGTYNGDIVLAGIHDYMKRSSTSNVRVLRMKCDEARPLFADRSIDLLHIDAGHEYEEVKHDFETWLPAMSDRGVVCFHDTHYSYSHHPKVQVWRFWKEIKAQYPHFEFPHACGVGLLSVGKAPQLMVTDLCFTGGYEREAIQRFMSQMGQRTIDVCTLVKALEAVQGGSTAWMPPLGSLSLGGDLSSAGSPVTTRQGTFSGDTSSDEAGLSVFERILTQRGTTATSGSTSRTDGKESASDQKT